MLSSAGSCGSTGVVEEEMRWPWLKECMNLSADAGTTSLQEASLRPPRCLQRDILAASSDFRSVPRSEVVSMRKGFTFS